MAKGCMLSGRGLAQSGWQGKVKRWSGCTGRAIWWGC